MMIANDRTALLGRLLVAQLLMFGAAAMNTVRAEDAAANAAAASTSNSANGSAAETGASAKGSDKAQSDAQGGDKAGGAGEGTAERQVGTKNGASGAEEPDSKGGRRGDDHAGARHDGATSNPIDTRITVLGRSRPGRTLGTRDHNDHQKTKTGRPAGIADHHHRKLTPTNKNNVVRNAIGQRVSRTQAASRGMDKKGVVATAVGDPPKSAGVGQNGAAAAGANAPHQGFVPAAAPNGGLHALPPSTAVNHSAINGAAMIRPGVRPGAVGGATRTAAGVINGTDFRPRHP